MKPRRENGAAFVSPIMSDASQDSALEASALEASALEDSTLMADLLRLMGAAFSRQRPCEANHLRARASPNNEALGGVWSGQKNKAAGVV
jgi:hypothetical protein